MAYYRKYKEETVTRTLHYMRAQIIREGLDGLEHVEALLGLRGENSQHVPKPQPKNRFKASRLKWIVMDALREGPKRGRDVAGYVAERAPQLTSEDAYKRTYMCLSRMKRAGTVGRDGMVWKLIVDNSDVVSRLR